MENIRISRSLLSQAVQRIAVCALILALTPVALRWIVADYSYHNRGVAWGEAPRAAFGSDGEIIGINAALENEDQEGLDRSIALITDGGYSWVRQPFPWREVEPARGRYEWQKWDRLVAAYANAGLNIVARLDQPPNWSRQDNNWANRPPDALADYAQFVGAFVSRYKDKVRYIQIWDEPNIFPNWGNRAVDPPGYVELLKVAHNAARAANPDVKILTAGLAPNAEKGGRNMADTLFLEAMYRGGASPYFDVLAAKPYGLWNPPDDRRIDDGLLNLSRVIRLREIMTAYGDSHKPVWAVEYGWNALPQDWRGEPSVWGRVTEEEQAAHMVRAVERARREWPWLQAMLAQGFGPRYAPSDPLYGFSVVDDRFRPRPVYDAIRGTAAYPFAPTGEHPADSRYVRYEGNWRALGGGKVGKAGESLTLPWKGTRLDLLVWRSGAGGAIEVKVDGKTRDLSPQLDSAGRFNLSSPTPHRTWLTVASGLEDGEHVLQLKVVEESGADGKGGEATIEAFVAIRDAPFSGAQALIAAGLALEVAAFLWLFVVLSSLNRLAWPALWPGVSNRVKRAVDASARAIGRLDQRIGALPAEWIVCGMSLGLAVFYFIPFAPVAAAGLVAYALLSWARLELGLLFVVLAAPFYLLPKRLGSLEFSVVEILVLTCLVMIALRKGATVFAERLRSEESSKLGPASPAGFLVWNSFTPPILLFVAASLLSLIAAERLHEGLRELRTVIVEPVIFYWLLVHGLSRKRVSWLADAMVIAAAMVAVVALYQYLFTADVITAEEVRRAKAFYGSPNNLGLFLGRVLPIALCLGWFGGGNVRSRLIYGASALLLALAIALTFSGGAWLGVAGAIVLVLAFRSARLAGVAGAGIVGLAVMLPQVLKLERITSRFDLEQGTVALRLMIWQAAAKMVQDHPLLGVGLDNFLNQYPRYMLAEAWREPNLSHPHNLVLDYWLRTGLLGLLAGLWLIGRFFASGIRLYRRSSDVRVKALTLGMLGSMTDFVLHGMIDNSYFTVDLAIIFWGTLAMANILGGEDLA